MTQAHENLGDMLVEEGVLSRDELEEVLEKSKERNLPLEETLFKLGYVSRDRLGAILAKLYQCDFIDLYSCRVNDEALSAIPPEVASRLRALPYALEGETLVVALAGIFEDRPLQEIATELERASGKKVRLTFCNPDPLKELLQRFYKEQTEAAHLPREGLGSIVASIKPEEAGAGLRGQFEELYDVGQTALIGARSHPFSRAVAASIEEARAKLADSKKYAESGFEEEAAEMATQAITLLKEATTKADSVEKDWEKLVQQVKSLRAKIVALEEEGAAQYASSEFRELAEIRDALLECVNERNVDRLRSLLDQGMIITEKVGLLSPDRNRGREQVIASLAQVREVIARARKVGAKDHAPDVLKEAYDFLDKAEACARRAHWDEVRDCLFSAEAKAVEAEGIALQALEREKQLTVELREAVRDATAVLEQAMAHSFAQEVIGDLMRAKDMISEAKSCFETGGHERGIGLAQDAARRIREEIIPGADDAERAWNELFRRADEVSAHVQSIDIPLAMKVASEKMEHLFQNERNMVSSLCGRDRDKLADAISACEGLIREINDCIDPVREGMHRAEGAIANASGLLAEAAASGVDEKVAPAYEEARRLLEEARHFVGEGNADGAMNSAEAARAKLQAEVIERQKSARERWLELIPRSTELFKRVDQACSPDAVHYCPELVHTLEAHAADMFFALAARDPEKMEACIAPIEETMRSVAAAIEAARSELHRNISQQLAEIEEAVQKAVRTCSGSYAPDMLEGAYLDLNRMKEQVAAGPEALDAALESSLMRDLAVARTKVWQVEFLRERFERERQEDLEQLRLKMTAAREEIDECAKLDFIGEASPLVQQARSLLDQADNLLMEGDIEGSFELVRQSRATPEQMLAEAEKKEQRWKELAESLSAEGASHRTVLADPASERIAEEEYRTLSVLAAQTQSMIDAKDVEALERHAQTLSRLSDDIVGRVETSRERSRANIETKMRDARQEIRLAELLKADDFCPDVINAARAFIDVAQRYADSEDFARADSAVRDAAAKARDAGTLAQAGLERAGSLALDYMKIASAHITQQQPEAATQALARGLALAELARASRESREPAQPD